MAYFENECNISIDQGREDKFIIPGKNRQYTQPVLKHKPRNYEHSRIVGAPRNSKGVTKARERVGGHRTGRSVTVKVVRWGVLFLPLPSRARFHHFLPSLPCRSSLLFSFLFSSSRIYTDFSVAKG